LLSLYNSGEIIISLLICLEVWISALLSVEFRLLDDILLFTMKFFNCKAS
jgi:hypothetical protein